ncbi:hypothetical protein WJ01_07710 [Burkholderia vietnamiensis]|uniref:hypothetical protein n=1 Tax=Burkholderia vietnamiensis TaxID=60552 RepID=UPI0007583E5A|nr:hypothetical protein [Burkholderia vietnamiensis]KVE97366.1 hypothetical protein WJ01_07710 [Burkholderia vietnamiensis]
MTFSGVRRTCGVFAVACISAFVTQSASMATPTAYHVKGGTWLGCDTKDRFYKIMSFDKVAFRKAAVSAIEAGNWTLFRAGQTVYLGDVPILGGVIQLRREGDTEEYWTNREAISSK